MADITKESLRAAMLERRERLDPAQAEDCASRIARRLLNRSEVAEALDIGIYSPVRGEVGTKDCYEGLKKRPVRIYLPRIITVPRINLEFVRIDDWGQLVKGYAGILEPEAGLPATPLAQISLLVVPGVAFDLQGDRLGWGKGFYDRVLWRFRGVRIGLAYDFQILEKIPTVASDEKVNLVISELREVQCP